MRIKFEKKFKEKLDKFTDEIDVLIERRRNYKKEKNIEGYNNITKLLKEKTEEKNKFKNIVYYKLKKFKI